MDSQTKSAIKSLVLDLRHTLEDELTIVLKRYGLFTDREWSLEEPPTRLTDEADREIWRRIVTVVRRGMKGLPSASGGMKEGRTLPEASQDYVRESAFTFLNRLAGLKCLEVRDIIDEVITTRDIYGGRSKAHRDYRDEHPRQARAPDDALPACIRAVCRRVNDEMIGYLFDPDDDHSLVWPRYAVLKGCIEKINALHESVWAEDEIIGWIYQFYNAEEKVAIRKRGKPQTPHDVAVINQFFTPRWVVKFLVDNTLGRFWLEMHPDSERVRAKCDYLVPEPLSVDETGGGGDKETGGQGDREFRLDSDSPINNPRAAPRREPKPITRIRLLDPACGTMHFGHYACEVFDCMYRDARDRGEVEIEDARIPSAILEHNLFGVDIDRRAVQLAALSLFMKARTMHPQAQVRQVNLAVADATLPDSGIKEKFLARYAHDKRVQKAFAQVLDDMDNVAQVGSLLRVEERLRELLAKAGHAAAAEGLAPRRQRELPGMKEPVRQMGLAELAEEEQATGWTPHYTLQELRDDLRAFAREVLDEHDLNAQLFATEADKAMRLLDVLMGRYDVVVMNPPYGTTTAEAREYLQGAFPNSHLDIYCAFVERCLDLCSPGGCVGAFTSRSFLLLPTFANFRRRFVLSAASLLTLAEFDVGLLDDATVRPVAYVLRNSPCRNRDISVFFGLRNAMEWRSALEGCLQALSHAQAHQRIYVRTLDEFSQLRGSPLSYWIPASLRQLFQRHPPLDRDQAKKPQALKVASVTNGLQTGRDELFLRWHWELPEHGLGGRWKPCTIVGSFSPYYKDLRTLVDWAEDGNRIAQAPYTSIFTGRDRYFQQGLTYPNTSERGLDVRYLPPGAIPSRAGPGIYPTHPEYGIWYLMGVLNSALVEYLLTALTVDRVHQVGMLASLPIACGRRIGLVEAGSKLTFELRAAWDTGNEICTRFTAPWLLQLAQPQSEAFAQGLGRLLELLGDDASPTPTPPHSHTLSNLLDRARAIEDAADVRLQALQAQIDEVVYDLYEISPADRALIERELGDRPPELVWPQLEGKSDEERRREHVRRFFSYYARRAVREDEDGIVPLAGCAARELYLVDRVRAQLEAQFGSSVAYQLEQEGAEYLGRPVEEWLQRYFFARFHVKLYKKRPVLWHLTSPRRYFAVMVDYHRMTHDTLPKVQSLYLWPHKEEVRTRLAAAQADEAANAIARLEDELADLEDCNARLERVIQATVEISLPDWANGPYRDGKAPYNPDIDDGVKVNLLPIQEAGLLPVKKVV